MPEFNMHSGAWVGDYSGWTLKFRATYPANAPEEAVEVIHVLLETTEPARAHLAACAAFPPADRTGQIKEDESLPIVGALMLAAHAAPQTEPATEIWCAESLLPVARLPLLLWRNIGENNGSSPLLRVSGGTNGPPPIIEVVGSSLGTLTSDVPEDLVAAPLDYLLIGVPETTPLLYASFDGVPNAAVLGPVVERIFLGERMPVASLGEGGSINIHIDEEN